MRRTTTTIGAKLPYPINSSSKQALISFSTSSFGRGGSGGGRGRGSGGSPPRFDFFTPPRVPGQPPDEPPPQTPDPFPLTHGHGRGRGKPVPPPSPVLPSFVSSSPGRGRGSVAPSFNPVPPPPSPSPPQQVIGESKEEDPPIAAEYGRNQSDNIASLPPGAGRGQPEVQPPQEVNRHARRRRDGVAPAAASPKKTVAAAPKMSRDEALKHAMGVLGRNAEEADIGGRGRGRGRGRGMGGRRGRGRGRGRFVEAEDEKETELYLGNNADGERLAKTVGPEIMSKLAEGFEEIVDRVLPDTIDQMHLEALDVNLKLECEPEFLMGDLERNPDIDEKPPIPLRDALEKAKPFLMAYENIESQEEWEEIMKETMDRVPLLKEIVDHYSGPGRVTAKKQHQELERVAKTLPGSASDSVKQFTERAVLSLQSNPGWGFHRKCQLMDKLVWRMSQRYK